MKKTLIYLGLILYSTLGGAAVSPQELKKLKERIQNIYDREITSSNANLKIVYDLSSPIKGAFAKNDRHNNWQITVHGGLIEHPKMNYQAMGLILCHEVGHFLGGAPYVQGRQLTPTFITRAPKNMSAEGQADFFATADCGKKIFAEVKLDEDYSDLPKESLDLCDGTQLDERLCLQLIKTSKRVIDIYTDIVSEIDGISYKEVSYVKKDITQTDRTLVYVGEYPGLQCRLDTMLAGISFDKDEKKEELRPGCWYKSESYEKFSF